MSSTRTVSPSRKRQVTSSKLASPRPDLPPGRGGLPLHRKQPVEERAILPERDTQVLGGHLVTAIPLPLQSFTRRVEAVLQLLDRRRNQIVRLLYRGARLVDESRLHAIPLGSQILHLGRGQKRTRRTVRPRTCLWLNGFVVHHFVHALPPGSRRMLFQQIVKQFPVID